MTKFEMSTYNQKDAEQISEHGSRRLLITQDIENNKAEMTQTDYCWQQCLTFFFFAFYFFFLFFF